MIKRPLVWILAVWILGEIIATHLGYSLTPKTDIDVLVSEHGQIKTEAEGKVVDLKENDYGLSLVLDDVFVQVPDSVRFSSEDYIVPGRYEMKLASDTKATSYMDMTDCAKLTGHVESTGHVKLTDYMKPMNYMEPIDYTKQTGYMGQTGHIKLTSDTRATGYVKLSCRISVLCSEEVLHVEDSQIGYTNNDALQIDALHIGNRILVRGKLTEIEEATNPGQFDLRSWYRSKGIGFSMKAEDVSLVDGKRDIVRDTIRLIRKRLSENMERVSSGDDLGIFRAVLLGDKSDLSEEESEIFRRGGIAHILAVSGMHVSILGAGLFWLLRKAPVQAWIPPMCAAGFMLVFVVLTGASPSAIGQRPCLRL
ncbi:MAG: ComEC family DNA internalization-related competence protein [Lachnospiraceae bacterium]|nr:ComEC family DNA internalization-related competence protein [Lachnospiraceae bacterium]